ncbi:MAG: ATP-dependent DNA helicase RecG [Firmicutes bacterium]|nr:ATP-dependent DNA helicase RecG [Bacillota bacterium]
MKTRSLTARELGMIKITELPQVGESRARLFNKLGIYSLFDLLYYLPRRYEDRRLLPAIAALKPGEVGTVKGVICGVEETSSRRGFSILRVEIKDASGSAVAVWFNQPFLKKLFRKGLPLTVTGKAERSLFAFEIAAIDYEVGSSSTPVHVGRIVPVYGATEELSQRSLRRFMYRCLKAYAGWAKDLLPLELKERLGLLPLAEALFQIHFPRDFEALKKARERLVFEELFLFQIGLSTIQKKIQSRGRRHLPKSDLPENFLRSLPFSLTPAQLRVLEEIKNDLTSERRMYRLLQGDVGCGKTVVALYALFTVVAAGCQGALMAPTEVLAEQHYLALRRYAAPLGVRVAILTGSLSRREREECLSRLREGQLEILVGTHALLEEQVVFNNLGLIVIDEQHRFGVQQRDLLLAKSPDADVLVMTATPIPRSLALTVYGDLDLSVIDEFPPGRKGVKTYYLPVRDREKAYQFLKKELKAGRQAYVICPLIEESEKIDVDAAVKRAAELAGEFSEYRVGLLHGKLAIREKERVMEAFRKGEIQLLVATSVIEVGIDVPNASLIIIEGAERFGLAQLHQLRGRVGRGGAPGFCILIGNPQTQEARERIKALLKCQNGFQVAERDLYLRGPGELMGTRQHGLSDFRVVDIFQDGPLLEKTKKAAQLYFERVDQELREEINYRFPSLMNTFKY